MPSAIISRLSDSRRDARAEAVERVRKAGEALRSELEFAWQDCPDVRDQRDVADALLGAEQAVNAIERLRGRA